MEVPTVISGYNPTKNFSKGNIIFEQGDLFDNVYFVKSGIMKLSKLDFDGKEVIIRMAITGSIVGARSLYMKDKYAATGECLAETELVLIPKQKFKEMLRDYESCLNYFVNDLNKQIDFYHELHNILIHNTNQEKVAELILVFAHLYGEDKNGHLVVDPMLSYKDISSIIGIPYDNLTRVFSKFREKKIISYKDKRLEVLDHHELAKIFRISLN